MRAILFILVLLTLISCSGILVYEWIVYEIIPERNAMKKWKEKLIMWLDANKFYIYIIMVSLIQGAFFAALVIYLHTNPGGLSTLFGF